MDQAEKLVELPDDKESLQAMVRALQLERDQQKQRVMEQQRRVKRRKGRRRIADFENLPVTTHVHELSAEERKCRCCGIERRQIDQEDSWQIEYFPGHFERIHHVCMKYACVISDNQISRSCCLIQNCYPIYQREMLSPVPKG